MDQKPLHRKIIHIDMDAFYASIEQLDNPSLKNKAIAVGGGGVRGVVATASYEARKFGVKSAMPSVTAKKLCPHLIFISPRFSRYKEISKIIRAVFKEYSDLVEPLSLDEAYIDVTQNKKDINSAILIAREIKNKIFEHTNGLRCSAGVSINKFLAKIASDLHKPDGLSVILPQDAERFIDQLPVEQFFGVGKATAKKMQALGIYTGRDLKTWTEVRLVQHFGKAGRFFFNISQGIDNRPVKPHRIRKSISVEQTFEEDLSSIKEVKQKLNELCDNLCKNLDKYQVKGKTIILKVRYADFHSLTKSKSYSSFTKQPDLILKTSFDLLNKLENNNIPIRLLGLGISNLDNEGKDSQIEFKF